MKPVSKRNSKRKVSIRNMLAFHLILLVNIPILAIAGKFSLTPNSSWDHFKQFVMPEALSNTLLLILFTLLISGAIGVLLATVVALFDFPLKALFEWALYLPITIAPYIAAYVYAGMLSYTGIIQRLLREWEVSFPREWLDIMNLRGAVFIYSITLYPYIYGAVKSFLENHSGNLIDTARLLGHKPAKLFVRVILPLVRIPLIGGMMLVMMEVMSDYGVIKYFNIRTVSSVIFNSWFGTGETAVSVRLSFFVMIFILSIQLVEELMRGRKKYNLGSGKSRPVTAKKLKGVKGYVVTLCLSVFFSLSFLIPVGQMAVWAVLAINKVSLPSLSRIVLNTLLYSTLATVVILIINILIAHSRRWMGSKSGLAMSKLAQLGYSIPGAIIAIGTITVFVALDGVFHPLYRFIDPNTKKLVLTTSISMLLFAFVVRYLAIGYNSVNSAFAKVGIKYNDAARTLGIGRTKAMLQVELPMLKNSLIAGFILTFIDIIKELPLTLLLRPFNYNTLASRAYEYANDERIHEASVPALIIILLSFLAVIILVTINSRKGEVKKDETRNRKPSF